jgi:anaerobic selenocysteine-containing dehydrogenase
MDVQELGVRRGDWVELAQDRDRWREIVSRVKNLQVP